MSKRQKGGASKSAPVQHSMSIEQALANAYAHWNAGHSDQAEMLCRQVLAAWPGQADALHLLGVMAHAWGNLDLAIDYLTQACQAPRAPAIFHSNLCEMCRQKGLLDQAVAAGRRAVALDPSLAAAWNNLGIALQEAGNLEESLACLERTVALDPNFAEAQSNLGNTLKKLGRLQRAHDQYLRALSLNPNHADANSNLASVLNDLGRRDEALAAAQRAIDINPRHADAHINASVIEAARGNYVGALRWAEALLSFAPAHVRGLGQRASVLQKLERLDEALAVAEQAVALGPKDGEAHNTLGQVLQAKGLTDAATAEYEKAASLMREPGTPLSNLATLKMELGRKDEALAVFDRALALQPNLIPLWFNRADAKTFRAGDPDIARMEAFVADDGALSYDDRMALNFALGKAYLDAGDDRKAFAHLDEGNRMKRATFSYDPAAVSDWLKSIADRFPAARIKRGKGKGQPSDLPVFVLGMPRSGTTLVEQILAAHPQIHGAGELSHMQNIVQGITNSQGQPLPYPALVDALADGDLAMLGRRYLGHIEKLGAGKARVVDKMPANFLYAGLIPLMLPGARIIHVRRDPVDTCLSCYSKLFSAEQNFAYDLGELGRFYRDYEKLVAHWRKVLPKGTFMDVDYEAVVADLEGEARRLVEFCGLPWDESCLSFHEVDRSVRTASMNQVRQPVYRSSVGRWKRHAAHLGPLLAALGLTAEGDPVSTAGAGSTRRRKAASPPQ